MAKLCIAMARPARHRIELTEQERGELTRRARAEKLPFQEVQRARIVLYASRGDGGHGDRRAVGYDRGDLWGSGEDGSSDDRLEGLKDKPRAGRPRRFPPGAGRRGQGDRVRAAGYQRAAAARFSRVELHRLVIERRDGRVGVDESGAGLHEDAIKPWQTALVDLPARPRLRREGRPGARPLRQRL